jgi:hypothetical protein
MTGPVIIMSKETWLHLGIDKLPRVDVTGIGGAEFEGHLLDGIPVVKSDYCPTWGPTPKWWRRWFLGEKRERVFYRLSSWNPGATWEPFKPLADPCLSARVAETEARIAARRAKGTP